MRVPVPARLLLAALACLVVAACGGGSGDDTSGAAATTTVASGTTAAASQACADAAALKASVAELDQLDPPEAGKAGTLAALQKVRDSLTALKASARTEWGAQVTELDGAIEAFQTTMPGSTATACSGPCRRSSATWSGSIPPGRPWRARSTAPAGSRPAIPPAGTLQRPGPRLVQSWAR